MKVSVKSLEGQKEEEFEMEHWHGQKFFLHASFESMKATVLRGKNLFRRPKVEEFWETFKLGTTKTTKEEAQCCRRLLGPDLSPVAVSSAIVVRERIFVKLCVVCAVVYATKI